MITLVGEVERRAKVRKAEAQVIDFLVSYGAHPRISIREHLRVFQKGVADTALDELVDAGVLERTAETGALGPRYDFTPKYCGFIGGIRRWRYQQTAMRTADVLLGRTNI